MKLHPLDYLAAACLAAAVGLGAGACSSATNPGVTFVSELREGIPALLEKTDTPGAAVVLVNRDGVLWSEGFGVAGRNRTQTVDADTLFSIQSTTKSFTATAILIAADSGLVDLDAPITAHLPDFRVNSRLEERPEEKMTLRLLLSHRGGFTHEAPVGNNFVEGLPSFDAHVASISKTWLRYPVGERYAYSNLGIDLAAAVVQAASGEAFNTFVRGQLLMPIGMKRSRFLPAAIASDPNHAIGSAGDYTYPVGIPLLASGGLYTSANEIARFIQLQLRRGEWDGERIVSEAVLDEMHTIAATQAPYQSSGYGLGIFVRKGSGQIADHGGRGFGFQSGMAWSREVGVGYAILQNDTHSRELIAFAEARFSELVRTLDPAPPLELPAAPDCLERNASLEARLAGAYLGRGYEISVEDRDGVFGVAGSGFSRLCLVSVDASEITAVEPDRGFAKAYRFDLDTQGRPRRLVDLNSGLMHDYNGGPLDPPNPNLGTWRSWRGDYEYSIRDIQTIRVSLAERNGQLYFEGMQIVAMTEAGLFFTSTGEALDLRGPVKTWRNIPLRRVEATPSSEVAP